MTNATRTATAKRPPMDTPRKTAIAVGVLFLITFVTSISAALLYGPVVDNPRFILGAGADTGILIGALLELILIVANIGTALVLYPLLRKHNETLALGYVAARLFEGVFILIGILALITVVTLRQTVGAGADPNSVIALGQSLVAINRWTFVLGPGFVVGIGNGVLLGWLLYRSGLLSLRVSLLGLVGGPLVTTTGALVLLGVIDRGGAVQGIATIPEFLWEGAVLGIYLIVKGFKRSSPLIAGPAADAAIAAGSTAGVRPRAGLPTPAGAA